VERYRNSTSSSINRSRPPAKVAGFAFSVRGTAAERIENKRDIKAKVRVAQDLLKKMAETGEIDLRNGSKDPSDFEEACIYKRSIKMTYIEIQLLIAKLKHETKKQMWIALLITQLSKIEPFEGEKDILPYIGQTSVSGDQRLAQEDKNGGGTALIEVVNRLTSEIKEIPNAYGRNDIVVINERIIEKVDGASGLFRSETLCVIEEWVSNEYESSVEANGLNVALMGIQSMPKNWGVMAIDRVQH
jgi:hypothetical protein